MKIPKPILLFLSLMTIGTLSAQDVHNTLFNMSPLTLNPALTGAFEGTARIGGLYRAQAFGVTGVKGYYTPTILLDAPIIRGFRKNDWVGVGMSMYSDKAGRFNMTTNAQILAGSYHFAMDKQARNYLTLGINWTRVGRQLDGDKLLNIIAQQTIDTDLGGDGLSIDNSEFNNLNQKSFSDFGAGLMFRSRLDDQGTNLELGLAYGYITQDEYNLVSGGGGRGGNKRPSKIIAHGRYEQMLTEKWSIAPTFLFQTTAKHQEIALQAWGGYRINPDVKLNFGLGYRVQDAAKILFGIDYKDLKAALAYDITLSSLTDVNNFNGGFEIAAYYILKIYKKPEVKPAIFCPRF